MSTQLILYPQYYQGFSSTATPSFNEYVVNGINFTGLNSTTLHNTTQPHPPQDAIANSPASILGNWYRYTTTGGDWGAVTAPALAAGSVLLSVNTVTAGRTGVYQQLSGLAVGAMYDVKILINAGQVGTLSIEMYSGTSIPIVQPFSSNTTQITATFTASSTNETILIDYTGTAASILIESISVKEALQTPTLINADLQDGQVICDLYQEEDIPLSLSIDDFKNVAEQVKSYSKDFNLPATKRNNQIFNDIFEVTRSVGNSSVIFNPYVKTKCVLKEDGFILFEGYLRLIDVKDKEGEISYNVNLYSEVIALADKLKDQTFSDLNFTELTHDYNKTEIKRSWNDSPNPSITYTNSGTSGFRDTYTTLRYPFIVWDGNTDITTNTSTVSGPTPNNPELTALEQVFRPCIQLKYLINRIFAASGFSWTSNFFDSADFEKLYMDFNWGSDNVPANVQGSTYAGQAPYSADIFLLPLATATFSNLQLANYQNNAWVTPPNYNQTSNILTATQINETYQIDYDFQVNCAISDTVEFQWLHTTSSGTNIIDATSILSVTSINFWQGNFTIVMQTGDTLEAQFKTDGASTFQFSTFASTVVFVQSISAVTSSSFLETLRGDLGQWDFLKGIMTMFNLVSMVDESNPDNLLIEPYSDVFINNTAGTNLAARSIQHDWTEKIDVSQMELKPLTDLNKNTIFKFVEDEDDYAFRYIKNITSGHLYGSKEIDASGFTILEGTKEIIAEPFAATVSRPLYSQFANFVVPNVYSKNDDGTYEGFDNSPRVFYNNGIKSTGASYYIPAQNGLSSENQTNFLQFSHLSTIPSVSATTTDFVFASEQLIGLGDPPTDNLYSMYWQPYFNELYSPDTRTMTLKVNLSPSDVAAFKFYDTVFIKNRVFRVNKIDYKPNDLATVEFILIP
jgi:hypothetical protein